MSSSQTGSLKPGIRCQIEFQLIQLIETCILYGADPQAYFADVLTRLVNLWPASLLDQLMPWVGAAEHSNQKLAA